MSAARQGFFWWEIDITYYLLKALSWTGVIWDLQPVPRTRYEERTHPAAGTLSAAIAHRRDNACHHRNRHRRPGLRAFFALAGSTSRSSSRTTTPAATRTRSPSMKRAAPCRSTPASWSSTKSPIPISPGSSASWTSRPSRRACPSACSICRRGLEYNGTEPQPPFRPAAQSLAVRASGGCLPQINRFNAEAVAALDDPAYASLHPPANMSAKRGYGEDFLNLYLVPMSCAVWTTPPDMMLDFPAVTLLRFFHNHGFLGLHTQHPWRTARRRRKSYVEKITAPWRDRIRHCKAGACRVARRPRRCTSPPMTADARISTKSSSPATPTRRSHLLADADARGTRAARANSSTSPIPPPLHTDASFMPRTPALLGLVELPHRRATRRRDSPFDALLDEQPARRLRARRTISSR